MWEQFLSCIEKIIDTQLPMFLLGDFNVNVLSDNSNNFKDLLQRQGFSNLINGPTNFTAQPTIQYVLTSLSQTTHNLWKQETF